MKLGSSAVLGALILGLVPVLHAADQSNSPKGWEAAKPIMVQSCFGCHAPDLAPAPPPVRGSDMMSKRKRVMAKASSGFGMGDKFPFTNDDGPKDQLKSLKKMLSTGKMPPPKMADLQLGKPLSAADRKVLLDWVAGEQKKP